MKKEFIDNETVYSAEKYQTIENKFRRAPTSLSQSSFEEKEINQTSKKYLNVMPKPIADERITTTENPGTITSSNKEAEEMEGNDDVEILSNQPPGKMDSIKHLSLLGESENKVEITNV